MMKFLIFSAFIGLGLAMPSGTDMTSEENQMKILKKYGYMGPDNPMLGELSDAEAFPKAIADFQSFAGLPATGKVDADTIKMMSWPRCGNKDINSMGDMTRKKRYAVEGSMWSNSVITYRVSKYTSKVSKEAVDIEIARGFQVWSSVANLQFTRVDDSNRAVDIDISFEPTDHGDGYPFDGPGGTLAHAFFPRFGGDTHFDDAENWTFNVSAGINIFQVVAHEFGHSLGLSHSSIQTALMAPYYRGYVSDFSLDQDDIRGIQAIYGAKPDMMATTKPPAGTPPTTPTTTPMPPVDPQMPNPCADGKVDAMAMTEDNTVYAFHSNYYMKINYNGIAPGYPRKISDDWQGMPNDLDAVLTLNSKYGYVYNWYTRRYTRDLLLQERLYAFKGAQVWLYEGGSKQLSSGYPKTISEVFPGLPSNIDAAFRWSGNDRTYFIKGDQYYRYSPGSISASGGSYYERPGSIDSNYPRPLSAWAGLPSKIDAAFSWDNGRTYFFANDQYYRFNDNTFAVDTAQQYPRSTKEAWFGCSSNIEGKTTIAMESDIMNDSWMDVMENASDVSGQSKIASMSLISCVLTVLFAKLIN